MLKEDYPRGVVPKSTPGNTQHRETFPGHSDVPYLFTKFSDAVWLENQLDSLDELLAPDQELILANVEEDEKLQGRTPDDEMRRVKTLQPAYYIPSDRWVYEDTMTAEEQMEEIDRCMSGTREVYNRINADNDLSTTVIPLAKGWKRWHFERCRRTFEEINASYCAFDVTQYNSINMLLDDISRLIDVIGPDGVLLIGRTSPNHLRRCPPEVVAATGVSHWLANIRTSSGDFSREKYSAWAAEANAALRNSQSRLEQFTQATDGHIPG